MRLLLIIFLASCSLVERDILDRQNETKVRNILSSHKRDLQVCARPSENVLLEISIGLNKQISYFRVISKKADKILTDCLFSKLDLIYFDSIRINHPLKLKYLLTVK